MNFSNSDNTKAHHSHEKDMQRSWNLNLVEPADTFKSDMKVSQSCCTSIMWNSCSTTGAMEIWWLWYLNCAQSVQSVHHHHHQPEPLIDNRSLLLCYLPQIWTQPLECCSRNQSLGNMFFSVVSYWWVYMMVFCCRPAALRNALLHTLVCTNGYLRHCCFSMSLKQSGHSSLTSIKTFSPRGTPANWIFYLFNHSL